MHSTNLFTFIPDFRFTFAIFTDSVFILRTVFAETSLWVKLHVFCAVTDSWPTASVDSDLTADFCLRQSYFCNKSRLMSLKQSRMKCWNELLLKHLFDGFVNFNKYFFLVMLIFSNVTYLRLVQFMLYTFYETNALFCMAAVIGSNRILGRVCFTTRLKSLELQLSRRVCLLHV